MTEEEWLAASYPTHLFKLIEDQASERKCLLFSIACHQLQPNYDFDGGEWHGNNAAKYASLWKYIDGEIPIELMRRDWLQVGEEKSLPERGREWAKGWTHDGWWDQGDPHPTEVATLLRDIFGNPFRPVILDPAWLTPTVTALANGIYAERAFDRMPILADALEEAGCDNAVILLHCRGEGLHVKGCWVVDLVLGKA